MVDWIPPPTWTPGDSITAEKENIITNDLLYLKELIELGPVGPQGSYNFDGLYWECQNFAPPGIFDSDTAGDADIGWYPEVLALWTGTGIDNYAHVWKRVTRSTSSRLEWALNRYMRVLLKMPAEPVNRVWLVTGEIEHPRISENDKRHVGFKLDNTGLWASTGNGLNNTLVKIAEYIELPEWPANRILLEVTLIEGAAKFYLNGVLKATITDTLPTATIDSDKIFNVSLAANGVDSIYATEVLGVRAMIVGHVLDPWDPMP